jgi:sigma-B regulation protein RsbU (phosphoserine phosphatase)
VFLRRRCDRQRSCCFDADGSTYAIFRSLSAAAQSPAELLARANRIFCDGTPLSYFATVVSGRIRQGGEVEISNAGHCPPLHVHAGAVNPIQSTGMPLGIFAETEYDSRKLTLAKGDCLVLYSDGLTECFNPSGQQYGVQRLSSLLEKQSVLPPQQLLTSTLEDLNKFRAAAPRSDDLTIMIIRREQ